MVSKKCPEFDATQQPITITSTSILSIKRFNSDQSRTNLTFSDTDIRFPAIGRLEGFHPADPCLYRRVLVSVQARDRASGLALCGRGSLDWELQ